MAFDRIKGGIIGLALGDALGVPHEFTGGQVQYTGHLDKRYIYDLGKRFGRPSLTLAYGQYSDDTEMALVLARSLIQNGGDNQGSVVEGYIRWANSGTPMRGKNTTALFKRKQKTPYVNDPTGYDHYVKEYVKKFEVSPVEVLFNSENKKAEESQSNGALMRCFSLAVLKDRSAIGADVWVSNPSTITWTIEYIYVECLHLAIAGITAQQIWTFAVLGSRK